MEAILASELVKSIWALVKRFWFVIPMAILLVMLMVTRSNLADSRAETASVKKTLALAESNLTISEMSLTGALGNIRKLNARAVFAEKQLQENTVQAAADQARLEQKFVATRSQVAGLIAASKRHTVPCTLSPEAKAALEGM